MSLFKGAFALLYGDVSLDGAFASLIDIYVTMQGSVRSCVWRCVIRGILRLLYGDVASLSIVLFEGAFASLIDGMLEQP